MHIFLIKKSLILNSLCTDWQLKGSNRYLHKINNEYIKCETIKWM